MGQNSQAGSKTNILNLAGSLGGLLVGLCISLSVFVVLLYLRSEVSKKNAISAEPVPTSSVVSAQQEILDLAEAELESGDPARVKEVLVPFVDHWRASEDRIKGYRLLGEAELQMGHPQLAAAYFENLYLLEPSAENLFSVAMAYDAGGNNLRALEKYQLLAKREDLPPELDRNMIQWRIENIARDLGTPVPTLTATTD